MIKSVVGRVAQVGVLVIVISAGAVALRIYSIASRVRRLGRAAA